MREALSAMADDEITDQDEFTEEQLLEIMCSDPEAISAWRTTHLTRDVLQSDYTGLLSADFASRVSAQIANEQAPGSEGVVSISDAFQRKQRQTPAANTAGRESQSTASPARAAATRAPARAKVAPIGSRAKSAKKQNAPFAMWKPVAGLGLAASIAGVGLFFPQLWKPNQTTGNDAQLALGVPSSIAAPDATLSQDNPSNLQTVSLQQQSESHVSANGLGQLDNTGTRWRMNSQVPRNKEIEQRLNTLLTNHLEDASMGRVHGMLSHSKVVSYDAMPEEQEDNN